MTLQPDTENAAAPITEVTEADDRAGRLDSDDSATTVKPTVTGTVYKNTRPRGLAPWSPQPATKALIDAVAVVLDEYADYLPMTARQLFYRLVGTELLGKSEADYTRLCEALNRARRAGLVPWGAIRDDGTTSVQIDAYDSIDEVEDTLDHLARSFKLTFPTGIEIWVEAAGMVPMVAKAVRPHRVPVFSSGGFDSVTAKHEAARRIMRSGPTIVLHIGDYDPSGCAIVDSAADDVAHFLADYGKAGLVTFERIAVTPTQVFDFDLPTAPPKKTDRRGGGLEWTVQAEAFAPDQLVGIVSDAVERHLDVDALHEHEEREWLARSELVMRIGGEQ